MSRIAITEKIHWGVKTMLAGGATPKDIAEHFGISTNTIRFIKKSESLEEYTALQRAAHEKKPEPEATAQPAPVVQPALSREAQYETIRLLKEQNEYLKLISEKLACIVTELT